MKIAIYGDSFASGYEGWPTYLQDSLKSDKVTIFGEGGTSANFSYMKFLETHKDHDMIIFLWTSIFRNCLITRDFKKKKYLIHGFTNSDFYDVSLKDLIRQYMSMNNTMKSSLREFEEIDKKWIIYESVYSSKYPTKNFLEHRAMRDSVKYIRPEVINIECFSNSEFSKYGMSEICKFDWCQIVSKLNLETKIYSDDYKIRPNHLTFTQNKEFAEYLYKHINVDNFDIHETFVKPEKYYTMSKTLEESGFIV